MFARTRTILAILIGLLMFTGLVAGVAAPVHAATAKTPTVKGAVGTVDTKALTFTVVDKTTTTTVKTTTTTTYTFGKKVAATFADVVAGEKVSVTGTKNSDGSFTATAVTLPTTKSAKAAGTVGTVDKKALTFTVVGKKTTDTFTTTTATVYTFGTKTAATFADVVAGEKVSVKGYKKPNGDYVATHVFLPKK